MDFTSNTRPAAVSLMPVSVIPLHIYVASNTQSGSVNAVDAGKNSVIAVFSVGVRPLGIGIRMWPREK